MTKRALTILIVAVLLVGGATAAIAGSLGGGNSPSTHTMPNGQTMNGKSMDSSPMHTMSDGQSMPGSRMDK